MQETRVYILAAGLAWSPARMHFLLVKAYLYHCLSLSESLSQKSNMRGQEKSRSNHIAQDLLFLSWRVLNSMFATEVRQGTEPAYTFRLLWSAWPEDGVKETPTRLHKHCWDG